MKTQTNTNTEFAAQIPHKDDALNALEELRETLEALPVPTDDNKPRVSVKTAVSNTFTMLEAALEDRPRFVAEFAKFNLEFIDSLKTRALALWAVQQKLDLATSADSGEIAKAVEMVRESRNELLIIAEYAFRKKPEQLEQLAEIRSGGGYWDLGSDLISLSSLLADHWDEVGPMLQLTPEELERSTALATRFIELLRSRKDSNVDKLRDLRDRAYIYLARAYFDVMHYGRVLHRFGDYTEIYPGIFKPLKPRKSPSRDKEVVQASEPAESVTSPAPPA